MDNIIANGIEGIEVGSHDIVLDFAHRDNINKWTRLPSCDEFVGARRSKHTAVAYKGAIYIFGGDNGKTMLNDVLRFDVVDNSWCRAFTCGHPPLPRYHHSAVVHDGSMFIFGGYTGDINSNLNLTNKNDLFEYKFATGQWAEWRMDERPRPRSAHGAAVYNGHLYIFAGYDGNNRLNDMWCTSLNSNSRGWKQVEQQGESPPTLLNFPVAVVGNSMYVFSGQSGSKMTNSLFEFDFTSNLWTRISTDHILCGVPWAPQRRYGHTMVSHNNALFVFGGAADNILANILYCYDLDCQTWSIIRASQDSCIPCGRLFHAAVVIKDAMYIFGGTNSDNQRSSEMYRFQFSTYPKCTLHEDFGRLFKSQQFCDLAFLLTGADGQERKILSHKAIVGARSSYLRHQILAAMNFEERIVEDGVLQISLSNVSYNAFFMILTYMYTDRLNSPGSKVEVKSAHSCEMVSLMVEVYELAVRFCITKLNELCLYHIDNALNHKNVLTALHDSHQRNLPFIKELCLRFIVKEANYTKIIMSKEFEELHQPLMVQIIRRKQEVNPFPASSNPRSNPNCGSSLEEDMCKFLASKEGESLCDLLLVLGADKVPAHKAVLAARCSYFEAMFRSFMPDDNTVSVSIGEREMVPSPQAFHSLLQYIYYGDVTMPPEDSLYLLSASTYYGFANNRLQAFCKHNLELNVCMDNCLQILEVSAKIHAQNMKKHALSIIVKNFAKVAKHAKMKRLNQELLLDIIEAVASKSEE